MRTALHCVVFAGLGCLFLICSAQPIITASGTNPNVGESFIFYVGAHVNPGSGGMNQNWDFTSLAGSPSELTACVAPSTTTNASSFPLANVAWSSIYSGQKYFTTSISTLEYYGSFESNYLLALSDPEEQMHYPFMMGSSFTDTWFGQSNSVGLIYSYGTTTVTADGYGTMVTPAGTFTNALRVHFVSTGQDSFPSGNAFLRNIDQYLWYQEGIHHPIAITYLRNRGGMLDSSATYFTVGTVETENPTNKSTSARFFPNPASDQLTFDLELDKMRDVSVSLFNALGTRVNVLELGKCSPGIHQNRMDVSDLCDGIYLAKVALDGVDIETKRIVVKR